MDRGLVRVEVRLKKKQRRSLDKWELMLNGEKREVTQQNVEWFATSFEDAISSFSPTEVSSVRISDREGDVL
jgi:hypothetical protein